MTTQNMSKNFQSIINALEQNKLKKAFDILSILISGLQNWQLQEQLDELQQTYKVMLKYVEDDIEDPQRPKVYKDLKRSTYYLFDLVSSALQTKNAPSYYYDKKRIFLLHEVIAENLSILTNQLEEATNKLHLNGLLEEKSSNSFQLKKEVETISEHLFNYIWLCDNIKGGDKQTLSNLIKNDLMPVSSRCLIITALTLNLLEGFDENKLILLLEACDHPDEEIRQRAITGLLLIIRKYDKRLYLYDNIKNRLSALSEDQSFVKSAVNIILKFILSKETEKITKRITEEIIPEMMKINPILSKKIKLDDLLSDSGMEDKNPEWQNIIEEAGLNDKLQEFSELQMSGADVMHSSFAHLKTFSFFNETSNWFVTFSSDNTIFGETDLGTIADILSKSAFLCNSDKYSFCLSLLQMPESMRKMMTGQLSSESAAMEELMQSELPNTDKSSKNIANQYIRDLYRFYKLHPRKADFEDIFEVATEFYQVENIENIISCEENFQVIGEYYFSKNYYRNAIDIFNMLLKINPENYVIYEKRAYCLQMTGELEAALNDYLNAETLNPSNSWTIKKIASCYRILKKPEEALIYYRKAEQNSPDNLSIQLNIGHCYLELKNYQEALKYYFKVDYLDKNGQRAWRPIAWCSFLTGKYQQALDYFAKILENKPESTDFLNSGHVYLAMGNTRQAIQQYILSAKSFGSFSDFLQAFMNDIPELNEAGVNNIKIPLFLDLIQYEL